MLFSEDIEGAAEEEEGAHYPPTGKTLVNMVKDIYHNKKLPAVLPRDAVHTSSFPSALIPPETFCRECLDITMLSEPAPITSKAKIVSMTYVINGRSFFYCAPAVSVY